MTSLKMKINKYAAIDIGSNAIRLLIMTVIEIGNAINKLLFWWQFGEKPSQSRKKTRENYKYVKRKVA